MGEREGALPYNCSPPERREMALWCFPIISDLVADSYGRVIGARHASLRMVAFCHSQLWQAMLLDDHAAASKSHGELRRYLDMLDIPAAFADEVNDLVLDELMDVVTQRFHRTPFKASTCGHILLHVAKNLTYTPEALNAA